MNSLKLALLMLSLLFLFGLVGFLIGGPRGLMMALSLALAMNLMTCWYSDKLVIRMYRAREITESDHPRLYRIVRAVAHKGMITDLPKIYIVPSKAPNAFATGRNRENAAIAVSEGLLELLNDDELEGVVGHEFAHIQNNDILLGTVVATFVGAIGILAYGARWSAVFSGNGRDTNRASLPVLMISAIIAPLVAMVLKTAISRQREFKADEAGCAITSKYLPLANALEKLHRSPRRLNLDTRPGTASMMIVNPISGRGFSRYFSTHPPVEERITRLRELDKTSEYQIF